MDSAPPDRRNEEQRALLRQQPWGQLVSQLTAIALKRIRGRSMADAQDIAQTAMADAWRTIDNGGWDPAKAPLMSFLVARIVSMTNNERRRKRNVCEVWLDEELEGEEEGVLRYEKYLRDDKPDPEETLARLEFASTFHDRLVARVAGDDDALVAITLMKEGIATPLDLAKAAGRTFEEMKGATRRIRHHAAAITKELSASHAAFLDGDGSKEVMQ